MQNYIESGENPTLTAPAGGVQSGHAYLIGAMFVVACISALEGELFTARREGIFELPKTAANSPAQGAKAYWNDTAKEITTTASGNTLVGFFSEAAGAGTTTARVLLTGQV